MATLQGRAIKDTYKDLLQVSNSNNGVDGTLRTIEDGEGTSSALQVSSSAVKVNGTLDVTGAVTGVPHVDYKGNYSGSTTYIKDDVVFYNGSSYIAKGETTGNFPTSTVHWGLLAQKGTDGTDGTDGTNGATGPQGPAGPQGPQGPAGADGADGIDGSNFNGGTITNSLTVSNSVPQLWLTDSDENSSELGYAAILSCNQNVFRLSLGNDTVPRIGLSGYNHPTDSTDTTNYSRLELNSAIHLGSQRTSAVRDQLVTSSQQSVLHSDNGKNLCWRGYNDSNNNAHRLYVFGHADTEAEVARNVALHLASDKHDTPTNTLGFRNTGRSINYTGTSDPNIEIVGTNIKQYQTAIQTQKTNLRTSITLQYEPEDASQSDWNGGVETGLSGAGSGEFAGLYLTAAASGLSQQRSLRPSGWFDGAMNLGDASTRFSTVYATGGSINTSDRNVKQDIEDLSDAEKSVAVALKGLIKKYRFKDAVALKGDDARIHVGVIAQDVEQAFADAGLDGFRYGILCKDTVYKVMVNGSAIGTQTHDKFVEEGPDGEPIEGATLEAEDRYAVRYEELLAFVISAL